MRPQIRYGSSGQRHYYVDGLEVSKEKFDEAVPSKEIGVPAAETAWTKPIHSQALAVHPNQVPQMAEINRQLGAPLTEYDHTGAPIFTSREHRRNYMRPRRYFDRDGGYNGD